MGPITQISGKEKGKDKGKKGDGDNSGLTSHREGKTTVTFPSFFNAKPTPKVGNKSPSSIKRISEAKSTPRPEKLKHINMAGSLPEYNV